jgi:HEAT repeat protein
MVEPRALPALERVVGRQNVDDQHVTSTFERMNIPLPDSFPKQPPGTITDTGAIAAAEKAISNIVHGDEEPLLLAMKDINAEVRESVVDALSRRPPTNRAIETLIAASNEPLIDALQDKNPQHRMSTAWTLYWIWHKHRTERIAELLMDAMKKRDMAIIGAAYGFFITQSQPGTESILIRALNEHGDPEMAEHFLNCGNSKLRSAATRWANIHNYQFIHSSSSGGPIWLDLGGRK